MGKSIKLVTMGFSLLAGAIFFVACKDQTNKNEPKMVESSGAVGKEVAQNKIGFKDSEVADAYQHYTHIKTALVNSDQAEAKNGAEMLVKVLGGSNGEIKTLAQEIAASTTIDEQRRAFAGLSEKMQLLVNGSLSSGELYLQYCPMALDNKGASWLSDSKKIKNPYFGSKMLSCGSVQETIN